MIEAHTPRLMARVTVEDCLARVPNRFALTILAGRRARALSEGRGRAMVECDNKEGVTALREVGADSVRFKEAVADTMVLFIEEQRRQLRITTGEHTFLEAASLRALEDDDDDDVDDDDSGDVEELQSDPEALNKQASKNADDSDSDADDSSSSDSDSSGGSDNDSDSAATDGDDFDDDSSDGESDESDDSAG